MSSYLENGPAGIDQIVDSFQQLSTWEERYSYLIELGDVLPALEPEDYCEENRFRGCQSSVWLSARLELQQGVPCLQFLGDSDSKIVRGLIAILQAAYSGRPAQTFLEDDVAGLFRRLELDQHLGAGRRNGLHDMEMRLRHVAASTSLAELAYA